jgi:predicted ATPase
MAIDVAQAQCAKGWELRTTILTARLWCEQGKRTEARDLLAPMYSWFTEGFDTLDLKEAKALLDELNACWARTMCIRGRNHLSPISEDAASARFTCSIPLA